MPVRLFDEFWEAQNLPSVTDTPEPRCLEEKRFADLHVHGDPMRYSSPEGAQFFGAKVGSYASSWLTPENVAAAKLLRHVEQGRLEQIGLIYEDPRSLWKLRAMLDEAVGYPVNVLGFYFLRYSSMWNLDGLLAAQWMRDIQAIKIHPVRDWFAVDPFVLREVAEIAIAGGVPLAIHSDDRCPETVELTRPERMERLAEAYPDLRLIIMHGIYANPRHVGMSAASLSYWNEDFQPLSRREILVRCLDLARDIPSVFLDLTILTNKVKALVAARYVNEHPRVAGKLFLGTDYPIRQSLLISQIKALHNAGMEPGLLTKIVGNRFSIIEAA